jgi:hypothetical protein
MLAKQNYFRLALGLLGELRTVAKTQVFCQLIEFVAAKVHLRANRFELFYEGLPPITLKSVQSLASSAMALFNSTTFDVAFASIKLLAKAYMERGLYRRALYWSELMIMAIQTSAPKELGQAHYLRGRALMEALFQNPGKSEEIKLQEEPDAVMQRVATPVATPPSSRLELLLEALASFEMARVSQRRVGGIFLAIRASLAYLDLVLSHFLSGKSGHIPELMIRDPELFTIPYLSNHRKSICNPQCTVIESTVRRH